MSFLQFFIWGAWLITIANYWFETKNWGAADFGAVFSTLGLSSLFMPTLMGIVADRWINTEKLFGLLHLLGGITLFFIPQVSNPNTFFWVIFLAMIFYMPTIALSNSIAFTVLKSNKYDVVKDYPPIRVWGTIGFIAAMWVTNLTGNKALEGQFYLASFSALVLAVYSIFIIPSCPPIKADTEKIHVVVAGYCMDPVETPDHSNLPSNFEYRGKYRSPDDLPSLYEDVDLIWACYPGPEVTDPDWRWALSICRSNRFYESCFFQKPLISLSESGDGLVVDRFQIGLGLTDQTTNGVTKAISAISPDKLLAWRQ